MDRLAVYLMIACFLVLLGSGCNTTVTATEPDVEKTGTTTSPPMEQVEKPKAEEPGKVDVKAPEKEDKVLEIDGWVVPKDEGLPGKFYSDIADVFMRYARFDTAQELFEEALVRETNDEYKSLYHAKLAEIGTKLRKSEVATANYEKASELTQNPDNKKRYYKELAKIYGSTGKSAEAIEAYRYLYDNEEDKARKESLKRQLYQAYDNAGKIEELTSTYEKELEENPESVPAMEELVMIYSQITREPAKAVPYLEKLASMIEPPDNRTYLNQLSAKYAQLSQYDKQAGVLLKIAEQVSDVQRLGYVIRVAQVYGQAGNSAKAIEYADKALEMKPDDLSTLIQVAYVYIPLKKNKEAMDLFDKALELSKSDIQKQGTYYQYAMGCMTMKDYDKAEELFDKAMETVTDPIMKQQLISSVSGEFQNLKMNDRAEKWSRKMIDIDPKTPGGYLSLVSYYARNEKPDKVLEVLETGLSKMDTAENKLQILGPYVQELIKAKQYDKAREGLTQITSLTEDKRILLWVTNKQGEIDKAEKNSPPEE